MKPFKINQLKPIVLVILVVNLLFTNVIFAQDGGTLNVGDNAPALVLSSNNNSIQSFAFPYQNKVVLVFFWSSSVAKSKENIYKYKRLYSKYSSLDYKSFDGFDMLSVALQSDKNTWTQDLLKYRMSDINNCISLKGYNDFFVRSYKIKETPSSFLIDEGGKIVAINPSLKTIITYLDERRNLESQPDIQTKLSGKVMYGTNTLSPLANEKIWFMNNNDTIKTTTLDEKGRFFIDNVNTAVDLKIFFLSNTVITEEHTVFLTSDNGEIISAFSKNEAGFEYKILDIEVPYLMPLFFNENRFASSQDKSLKNLNVTEKLFKAKETVLSKESQAKINAIILKLKQNPKTRLEINSHTDSNGDSKSNKSITLSQANSIVAFLISKGIDKSRLMAIGKGEDEISNKCKDGVTCPETEHVVNRRVEFKFYSIQ